MPFREQLSDYIKIHDKKALIFIIDINLVASSHKILTIDDMANNVTAIS